MPRTKVAVPNVAEAGPGLWTNGIRAGDFLFISGQVARPFEGGGGLVGTTEYEQAEHRGVEGQAVRVMRRPQERLPGRATPPQTATGPRRNCRAA
jgi:enamine deaminase RidA (YjgF/YER057c/UK114 family)